MSAATSKIILDDGNIYASLSATAKELQSGRLWSQQLCRIVIDRFHELEPYIGAYSDTTFKSAITEAIESDSRRKNGSAAGMLDGIPIAIKDLVDTTPATCRAGLRHRINYLPDQDAAVVTALRRAGAIIIGVTATDSGAFGTSTPATINPTAPSRITGGSSGGSAAAVAAGLAFAAIGTDTGGSIRIPSACCSVCGFKPSWGRVPLDGVRPLAPSFDHIGPIARSVTDLRIVQSVLDPDSVGENLASHQPLKIGFPLAYYADATEPVQSAMAAVLNTLRHAGYEINDLLIPTPDRVLAIHMVNALKEIADYHTEHFSEVWESYPEIALATVKRGASYQLKDYEDAERERRRLRSEVERAFESVDVLILPAMPMDAPFRNDTEIQLGGFRHSLLEASVRYTALFNQTGHPVVAMPGLKLRNGRAIGLQVVGKLNSDANLLLIAQKLEEILAISIDYNAIVAANQTEIQNTRLAIGQGDKP